MKIASLPLLAPRVHHAARRRGGSVAARGAGAAGRASAADRLRSVTLPKRRGSLAGRSRRDLRELGWIEGQNIVIEYRWAESAD